jgi:hypothetical protein
MLDHPWSGAAEWLYAMLASVVFGATVYETLVVHPAWSRKPPESFAAFMGDPIGRMNLPAFWIPVAPIYALGGLFALTMAFLAGRATVRLEVSAACAVATVVWTLAYFRPTVSRFLEKGGGGVPAVQLRTEARRWILLNWFRLALVAVAWWGATAGLACGGACAGSLILFYDGRLRERRR